MKAIQELIKLQQEYKDKGYDVSSLLNAGSGPRERPRAACAGLVSGYQPVLAGALPAASAEAAALTQRVPYAG